MSRVAAVEHGVAPKRQLLEVTTAVHANDYLRRRLLHEKGGAFGGKGITRDKRTGEITSRPVVHKNDENAVLAGQIIERLTTKNGKGYPPARCWVIQGIPNIGILDDCEWNSAIERIRDAGLRMHLGEVFIFAAVRNLSATLYGEPRQRRARSVPARPR